MQPNLSFKQNQHHIGRGNAEETNKGKSLTYGLVAQLCLIIPIYFSSKEITQKFNFKFATNIHKI